MAQDKKRLRKTTQKREPGKSGEPINGLRLPTTIKAALMGYADAAERSLVAQIRWSLKEWLQLMEAGKIADNPNPTPASRVTVIDGGSEPPRRIQQQAAARRGQAVIPPEVEEAVMGDDEQGWEGSDPRELMKGTKV